MTKTAQRLYKWIDPPVQRRIKMEAKKIAAVTGALRDDGQGRKRLSQNVLDCVEVRRGFHLSHTQAQDAKKVARMEARHRVRTDRRSTRHIANIGPGS